MTKDKPREWTEDEIRERLLRHVWDMVEYWADRPGKPIEERLSGLAFSILAALDGCAMAIPAFIVAPCPHESDKDFNRSNGDNWYPENHKAKVKADIGGSLHELFHKFEPKG